MRLGPGLDYSGDAASLPADVQQEDLKMMMCSWGTQHVSFVSHFRKPFQRSFAEHVVLQVMVVWGIGMPFLPSR